MSWTKQKSVSLLRQLRDITNLVEQLDHGVCELEAKQLAILTTSYDKTDRNLDMRAEANYLTAMNNSTADFIKSSLREIEEIVKTEMEGAVDSKELIQEFLTVLRHSIRVLQEYRLVQQSYVDDLNKRASISPKSHFKKGGKGKVATRNNHPLQRLTKFLRNSCICN